MNNLKDLIEPVVNEAGYRLYDCLWTQEGKMKILQVSIMDENGKMDIDTCASVSSLIGDKLDEADCISFEYYLEVCSPGAERELRSEEDIVKAIEDYVYIKFKDPKAGMDDVKGYLKEVKEDSLVIEYMAKNIKKKLEVERNNIKFIRLSVKI